MTRAVIQFVAQDKRGDIVPGAAVEIRDATTGALVQVWNSRTGGSLIGNPGATDSGGQFKGYINPARVNVHVEKGSFSRTWSDVAAADSVEAISIFSPQVTFSVPGDLSVTYELQYGWVIRRGRSLQVQIALRFNASFSSASGTFYIVAPIEFLPDSVSNTIDRSAPIAGSVRHSAGISYPAGRTSVHAILDGEDNGLQRISIEGLGDGVSNQRLSAANVAAGVVNTIEFVGNYTVAEGQ